MEFVLSVKQWERGKVSFEKAFSGTNSVGIWGLPGLELALQGRTRKMKLASDCRKSQSCWEGLEWRGKMSDSKNTGEEG